MKKLLIAFMAISLIASSCGTSKQTQGAIIGGAAGATAGGLLTKNNRAVGIILGAAIGGIAGGVIGKYMDKAAKDISDDLGNDATVVRVGEGIVASFDSGLLFDFDKDNLKPETKKNLDKLAASLNEFKDTEVKILGHTDNQGTSAYNQGLSERRASSVKSFLTSQGVAGSRLLTFGYGESDPVSTNETESGRSLNRRVEIVLVADEDLKVKATKNEISALNK